MVNYLKRTGLLLCFLNNLWFRQILAQKIDVTEFLKKLPTPGLSKGEQASGNAGRFTYPTARTITMYKRTSPMRETFQESCENIAKYCHKSSVTGQLCGRTIYWKYYTFENHCLLDYVNCMHRYDVWEVVHMGPCYDMGYLSSYDIKEFVNDYFLDQNYIIDEDV